MPGQALAGAAQSQGKGPQPAVRAAPLPAPEPDDHPFSLINAEELVLALKALAHISPHLD